MKEQILELLTRQKERFISQLSSLVAIKSVREPKKAGMPFGEAAAAVLAQAAKISAEHGFELLNIDNYAGEISFGENPELMLLAHLDVVEAGDGWTKNPYSLTREGDLLYGRGTTDDKGAALCLIYALSAAKELFGEPKTGVRVVLGCGEESGSEDMEYYFSKRKKLKYTLSPDADYPLINIEKGRFAPFFEKAIDDNSAEKRISEICGGEIVNVVPAKANALIRGFEAESVAGYISEAALLTGASFAVEKEEKGLRIYCTGQSCHAANPQKGCNAQTALLKLLSLIPFDKSALVDAIDGLCRLFPHKQTNGDSAGLKMSDEKSGALTLNFGVLSYNEAEKLSGALDLRVPLCASEADVKTVLEEKLKEYGFRFKNEPSLRAAHYVPEDAPIVKEALRVYESYTGMSGKCLAIGGGTYVHDIEGGIAFGIEFPGCDYRIHAADEFAKADELLLTAAMYTQIIKDLCY